MTDLLTVRVRWPMRSRGAMIALRFFTRGSPGSPLRAMLLSRPPVGNISPSWTSMTPSFPTSWRRRGPCWDAGLSAPMSSRLRTVLFPEARSSGTGGSSGTHRSSSSYRSGTDTPLSPAGSSSFLLGSSRRVGSGSRSGGGPARTQEFILKLLCCASICESVEDSDVYYLYRMPSGGSAMGLNLEGQFDYPRAMRDVLCFAAKPDVGMSPDGLEAVDRLLTDRFVGACAYAAETAFSNGASDSDVLSWLTDSLKGFDCHGALENGCCRSENRRFLRLWLGCSGMIRCISASVVHPVYRQNH